MGTSLPKYLEMRVHQAVKERAYDAITVVPCFSRTDPSSVVFDGEKLDKPFNWQRPTARVVGNHLYIECFPGYDHVEHYAEMIAAYLAIRQRQGAHLTNPSRVSFVAPSLADTQRALQATNIGDFPTGVHTVVLGMVHRLDDLTGPVDWAGSDPFHWTIRDFNGRKVAFVGFRPAFWGNISGELVRYLSAQRGVREVLYCGKLGGVRKGIKPNTRLATGHRSYVRGQPVDWQNVLVDTATRVAPDSVVVGTHVTLGSVVHETKDWLAKLPDAVDFVDPEIGMMAEAAAATGTRYGYLHIISDNLSEKYDEDLSNERKASVLEHRAFLYKQMATVLENYFTEDIALRK